MNVSLHQLKVFVAVARERSFTRAAREFDLTQSAVSRCVRELEDTMELKLFDRTTRLVELTSAGASLERRIGRLLDEFELTLREERAAFEEHSGTVLLASNPVLSSSWVPGALARCAAAFPALIVSVRDLPQCAVFAGVDRGEVDFGLVSCVEPFDNPSLHAQAIFATPLCVVIPHAHPFAQQRTVAWRALGDKPLVTLNADAGCALAMEQALNTQEVKPRSVQAFGHVAAVLQSIELGLGIGVLPVGAHWPACPPSLTARLLTPGVQLTTSLVRRRRRSLRPNAAAAWAQCAAPVAKVAAAPAASVGEGALFHES